MVDRVGNGLPYGYAQVNEKKLNTNATGTGEKFQLDYGKEGAIYEPSSEALKRQQDQKETVAKAKTNGSEKTEEDGVRLTLSGMTGERMPETQKSDTSGNEGGILDLVTNIVNKVVDTVKSFFISIWNDEPKVELPAEIAEKPKTQFDKVKEEAEAFLASSEGKKVAKNSDLLTYYDKHGAVISVSPSDRQRILYGDKNQIEV